MSDITSDVLREKIYNVKGTTSLDIYDCGYDQSGTNLEFRGNINAAPLGILRIREMVTHYPKDGKLGAMDVNEIQVDIFQAAKEDILDTYLNGYHYPSKVKKNYELNCETASFVLVTKFAGDYFETGADGVYGNLIQMKQYFGMILFMYFDAGLHSFEEIERRFLKLFPERKRIAKKEADL